MAMLGKKRPPRRQSGVSGLARVPHGEKAPPESQAPEAQSDAAASTVTVERLAHDGRGVARSAAGKTLFVTQALPGERVEVAVHRTRKRFDEAHVKRRANDSPRRVTPPCAYFGRCGGCDLQHMALDAQREHKVAAVRELCARQGLELPADMEMLATRAEDYRRRARLGVNVDGQGRVLVGFRAAGSQRLVDIDRCHVLVPKLAALLAPLREVIQALEAPRRVGHVELVDTAGGCAITVRQPRPHANDAERWRAFADRLAAQGVALALLEGRDAPRLEWLGEPPALAETLALPGLAPLELGVAPGDFLQANAAVNAQMVARVMEWLAPSPGERYLDLFAGIGNFSLPAAAAGASVTAVEGHPAMVERLAANARRNGLDLRATRADLNVPGTAAALLDETAADALILDPPRAGAEAICRTLADAVSRPAQLAYVSCDPATLARDVARLTAGGYRIGQVAVADMFVHTAHMETLMLLEDIRQPGAS
ncbi:TRAM domain-containing protein [Halomonas piscis]|uniref:TRAM domain-containing protein n=1 Tax=Halomonas piscis TaxID=3031727 RepID=UPI0028A186C8|nr:TRAM domain-containing protein [Halomonas piscis]